MSYYLGFFFLPGVLNLFGIYQGLSTSSHSWFQLVYLQFGGNVRLAEGDVRHCHNFTFTHWRRKWQPTPLFLPGESQGQRSLVGCHLCGHTELDTTEVT